MDYFLKFVTNIFILLAVVVGTAIFMQIFYPESLEFLVQTFEVMFEFISSLRLWPIVIVGLIVAMLPKRRRRR